MGQWYSGMAAFSVQRPDFGLSHSTILALAASFRWSNVWGTKPIGVVVRGGVRWCGRGRFCERSRGIFSDRYRPELRYMRGPGREMARGARPGAGACQRAGAGERQAVGVSRGPRPRARIWGCYTWRRTPITYLPGWFLLRG